MYISTSHLAETAKAIRTNKIDAENFIKQTCTLINKNDIHVKALIKEKNRQDRLIKEIKILKKKYPDIESRPPLFGIPVGIKDIINSDGFKTKAGSDLPSKLFKGQEASVVTKLKNAGAVILGKTVTTEFAYFEPGKTRNPHNIEHTPGGSSSGSAAAVAEGIVPLAIGTQTIGSIIRPAAYCGVIGFKPGFDRINKDGVIPFSVSADHIGIFTQDIEGIDLAASVLCNNWTQINNLLKKPTIGAVTGKYLNQANPEITEHFENHINNLKSLGFEIKRLNPFDDIDDIINKHQTMIAYEFFQVHKKWFENYESKYKLATKELILKGKNISTKDYLISKNGREEFRKKLEQLMFKHQIDVFLSPATTSVAPKGMQTGSPLMNLPWTYSGLPVITVPIGKSIDNLPIGVQLTGFFNNDEELIQHTKRIYSEFYKS
jgi:Asp-tRNA(Asn)/Glu-tRNA(Gln) amidotransferase A subunit family amidase